MVKIKTSVPARLGNKLNVCGKDFLIPVDGVIEVYEEQAKLLVEKGFGWEYLEEEVDEEKEVVEEVEKSEKLTLQEQKAKMQADFVRQIEEQFKDMSFSDLKQFCINNKIPEADFGRFKNVKMLNKYLTNGIINGKIVLK